MSSSNLSAADFGSETESDSDPSPKSCTAGSNDNIGARNPLKRPTPGKSGKGGLGWTTVWRGPCLEDALKYLDESGSAQCSGFKWLNDGKEKGKTQGVTNFCCQFKNTCKGSTDKEGCAYKCRILRDYDTSTCLVQETKFVAHSDHRLHKGQGLPKVLKAEILRQDLISAPAKKIRKVIMDMDFDDQSSIKFKAMSWRQRESKKHFGVESTMLGSWGGLFQWCSNNTKAAVKATLLASGGIFDSNTPYVVEGWVVNAEEQKCIIVHTSENLILNTYRASVLHKESKIKVLAMDHTYRLVHEGHATLLIGSIAPDQSCKVIAYATCTDEATTSITASLKCVQAEARSVLLFRAEHGINI